MKAVVGAVLAVWAAMTGAPVGAQTPPVSAVPRECSDDNGVDRCAAAKQAEVRKLFRVPAIESFASSNTRIRRAFFVDGYGRDMPVITFTRRAGEEPRVTVSVLAPGRSGETRVVEISGTIGLEAWNTVLDESRHFDRALAAVPGRADAFPVCLHSWVVTVESFDPKEGFAEGVLRRKTQDACTEGLTVEYAFDLAEEAVRAIPACAALDRSHHRNDVALLEACSRLAGDRLAAGQVMNRYEEADFRFPDAENLAVQRLPFTTDVTLAWDGEKAVGWEAAKALWLRKARELNGPAFHVDVFRGEREDRVRVSGQAWGHSPRSIGSFEQVWVLNVGNPHWEIERWTVGPFKPVATPAD